jgi:hypothetical protein
MKPRLHLRLAEDLNEWLDTVAGRPGGSKTAVVEDALRSFRNRRAANEFDDLVKRRMDRISGSQVRLERDVQIVLETLALFINHYFTITAPMPEADASARALGADRFRSFIDQVGRRIAANQGVAAELTPRVEDTGS